MRLNTKTKIALFLQHIKIDFSNLANANTDNVTDEAIQLQYGPDSIMATMRKNDGPDMEFRLVDFPVAEKLGKFMEDVK